MIKVFFLVFLSFYDSQIAHDQKKDSSVIHFDNGGASFKVAAEQFGPYKNLKDCETDYRSFQKNQPGGEAFCVEANAHKMDISK